ncbi:MAG: hypothetical protein F6K55_20970 [Moorea sp. SIO4A3]|nr:hypothetical protein [Moorena sp. SIO4A3]
MCYAHATRTAISYQLSAYELWASYTEQLLNKRCSGLTGVSPTRAWDQDNR